MSAPDLRQLPPPPDEEEGTGGSEVDRRYLELHAALVDATRLDRLPKAEPLIDGVLTQDSLSWLHGKPGHAKSFVALDWAACVATGRPWRGLPTATGTVLYVVAEGAHGMHERRLAWEVVNETTIEAGRLLFLPVAVQFLTSLDVSALIQLASDLDPVLIVVDTQARVTVGAEENSSKDMGLFVAAADRLRIATRACLLVVHHEARSGDTLRGSTALEGAATTVIRATRDGSVVRLDCTKQKDGPEFDPVLARLISVALPGQPRTGAAMSHDPVGLTDVTTESETQIVAVLRDSFGTTGASSTVLRETTGLPKTTFYRSVSALVRRGVITNAGTQTRTCYMLADPEEML